MIGLKAFYQSIKKLSILIVCIYVIQIFVETLALSFTYQDILGNEKKKCSLLKKIRKWNIESENEIEQDLMRTKVIKRSSQQQEETRNYYFIQVGVKFQKSLKSVATKTCVYW